jgi:hypothetical protein
MKAFLALVFGERPVQWAVSAVLFLALGLFAAECLFGGDWSPEAQLAVTLLFLALLLVGVVAGFACDHLGPITVLAALLLGLVALLYLPIIFLERLADRADQQNRESG